MRWTDRKITAASSAAFLIGAGLATCGAIAWKSLLAIMVPMLAGLGAAIIIVITVGREE